MATETITLKLVAQDLMSGNVSKAISGIDKLAQRGGLMGSVMQGVGQSFGQMLNPVALVSMGIGKVTDFMGDSISAASDQAEALSKVTVVFGDQAAQIERWAKTASTSMGMSETAALSAAGTLGNLFDGLGIAEDAGLAMSKTITQLAADLGSFNNVATDDALLALRSGLLGEAEPMRKFGSALSAARVEAYGFANGLTETVIVAGKTKRVMSEANKVQARYALMLEDTKNAQGDFARTSDGLANSQKTLDAKVSDLTVTVGRFLTGPAIGFVTFLNDVVTGIMNPTGASPAVQQMIEDIKNTGAALAGVVGPSETYAQALARTTTELRDLVATSDTFGAGVPESVKWVQRLGAEFLAMSDLSASGLQMLALEFQAAGGSFQQFRDGAIAMANDSASVVTSIVDSWQLGMKYAGEAVEDGAEVIEDTMRRTAANVRGIAWNIPNGIVEAVKSGIPDVKSVMKDLKWAIEHPMKLASTRAEIEGALTSKKLARGIRSSNPLVRQAAIDTRAALLTQWNGLPSKAMELGRLTIAELVRGLNEGEQYALGLYGETGTKSGDRKVRNRTHPKKKAGGGSVYAGEMYEVNEGGRREFFAPAVNGTILSASQTAAMGAGGGGTTVHVHFHSVTPPTEADGERIAASIGPALTRWQRRQGVVR